MADQIEQDLREINRRLDKLQTGGGSSTDVSALAKEITLQNIDTNIETINTNTQTLVDKFNQPCGGDTIKVDVCNLPIRELCNDVNLTPNTQKIYPTSVEQSNLFCSLILNNCTPTQTVTSDIGSYIGEIRLNGGEVKFDIVNTTQVQDWTISCQTDIALRSDSGLGNPTIILPIPHAEFTVGNFYKVNLDINYTDGTSSQNQVWFYIGDVLTNPNPIEYLNCRFQNHGISGTNFQLNGGIEQLYTNYSQFNSSNPLEFTNINTTTIVSNNNQTPTFFENVITPVGTSGAFTQSFKVSFTVNGREVFYQRSLNISSTTFLNAVTEFPIGVNNSIDNDNSTFWNIDVSNNTSTYQGQFELPININPCNNAVLNDLKITVDLRDIINYDNNNDGFVAFLTNGVVVYDTKFITSNGNNILILDGSLVPISELPNLKIGFAFAKVGFKLHDVYADINYSCGIIEPIKSVNVNIVCTEDNPVHVVVDNQLTQIPIEECTNNIITENLITVNPTIAQGVDVFCTIPTFASFCGNGQLLDLVNVFPDATNSYDGVSNSFWNINGIADEQIGHVQWKVDIQNIGTCQGGNITDKKFKVIINSASFTTVSQPLQFIVTDNTTVYNSINLTQAQLNSATYPLTVEIPFGVISNPSELRLIMIIPESNDNVEINQIEIDVISFEATETCTSNVTHDVVPVKLECLGEGLPVIIDKTGLATEQTLLDLLTILNRTFNKEEELVLIPNSTYNIPVNTVHAYTINVTGTGTTSTISINGGTPISINNGYNKQIEFTVYNEYSIDIFCDTNDIIRIGKQF